jgi:hypothetical protein
VPEEVLNAFEAFMNAKHIFAATQRHSRRDSLNASHLGEGQPVTRHEAHP